MWIEFEWFVRNPVNWVECTKIGEEDQRYIFIETRVNNWMFKMQFDILRLIFAIKKKQQRNDNDDE